MQEIFNQEQHYLTMTGLLKQIQKELKANSSPEAREAAMKFVPGSKKVYGIRAPLLNEMAKKYKEGGFELVKELWKSGAFEEKIVAAKMLGMISKKDPGLAVKMVSDFAKDISDWAVCDTLGMQSLKPVKKLKQEEIFALSARLLQSKNFWQRRLSLVIIKVFTKDKSLQNEILKRVKALETDEEYYVRKAVIWLKRNIKNEK